MRSPADRSASDRRRPRRHRTNHRTTINTSIPTKPKLTSTPSLNYPALGLTAPRTQLEPANRRFHTPPRDRVGLQGPRVRRLPRCRGSTPPVCPCQVTLL